MASMPLHKEIEQRFGVLPNFFQLASDTPEVTMNLWGFAQFAYLDSPLPSLFKERLFVYLSRFCEVRYCVARHIGFLVGLGYPAGDRHCLPQTVEQVLPLLQRSLPRGEELEPAIALCAAFDPDHFEFPSLDTPSESAIFACVTHVFLQTGDAPRAIAALRQGLGAARLEFFNVFLAFVRMAHYWTQIHPELRFEDDINHLLETHEALADRLLNDPEVKDNALSQQVLEELAELRQLQAEHESLVQKYEIVSRENEQLPIKRQQRQRVEAALRESDDQFRNMADSSPVLLWQTDETGATFVNRHYLEFFAQTFDGIKGMGWANFLHPDDAAAYLEAYRTAFERQERYEFQCRSLRHDGEYRWLQSVGEPHYGLDHTFLGFVGCLFDVTDIKAAEAVLKESEEQFRNMADNAPMMVWVTDTTGYCTYLSRSWYDFPGQTEATGLGFDWLDATHPDDRESAQAIFLVANDCQEAFQLEYRLRHQDGYYRTCIDAAKPWFGVNGEFKGYIGSVIDIEDRKRVEEISQQAAELNIFCVTLTDALRSLVDPVEIQATASRVLGEHLGATRVAYFEVCGADYVVERDYVNGVDALAGRYSIDSFGSKLLSAYRTGCTVSSPNIAADPYLSPEQQSAYAAIQIGAYIGIPLIKEGEFVAGLAVHAAAPRSWTPEEVALTEEVADRTWAAVERARAEVALRESEARLTADLAGMQRLYDLYATLVTGLDLKTALNEILVVACEFTQTDRGCVQLVSDDGTRLEMFTWHGYSDDSPFINHFRYEGFKQGYDQARVARQRFMIQETIGYPGLESTEAGAALYTEGIRAVQSTPIINRSGESIGVLSTQFSQPHRPSDDSLKLVDLLAWTAADFVERYRAHTALRESEKKYRSLFESINQGFCLLEVLFDPNDRAIDYRYLEINEAFEQQSGLVDAVGKTILELVPNLEPQWAECYEQVVKSGEAVRFEADVPSMNRVFDIYAFPRGAPGQNLVAVLFNDITDRKRGEQALQQSEARFRRIFECEMVPMGIWTITGEIIEANDALLDLIGYTRQELETGQINWQTLTLPQYWALDQNAMSEIAAHGFSSSYEKVYLHKDGRRIPILIGAASFLDDPNSGVFFVIDLTVRKLTEAQLREAHVQLESALAAGAIYTWRWKIPEDLVIVNAAFAHLFGVDSEMAAVGLPIELFVQAMHSDDRPRVVAAINQAIKTGEDYTIEYRVYTADGSERWLAARGRVEYDADGRPLAFPGALADITDRKTAEQEREQLLQRSQAAREAAENANRIKDEFLAVVSHELRSPLNPILGWSKLLQQGKLDGTKTAYALATIERNAQLQAQLIDDLLDISRILRGKLSFDQLPVDLRKVIASALETVHLAAVAKSLHIETNFPPNIGTVMGDAARLQQVVWNLLSNAVKFTPHNGRITIILTQGITHAQIQVTDNGKGINPEFLPYVFEHFRQEDGATTRKFGGLGLGLAIARQIVELHGGTIAVDSTGEGQGATFTVQLPLASVSSQTLSRAVESVSIDDDLSDIHILVVDDEPDSREFVAFVLEQAGASVINVTSGMEALQAIGQSVPDLIISDIGIPEMDGYMLMRQIRALQQGRQIPAIALTAYAGELDRQHARASGFQRHLAKPVSPTEIIAVVAHLCGKKGQISA